MRHWTGALLIVATLVVNGEVQGQHRPPTARLLPLDRARPTPAPETTWVHVRDADDRSATFQIAGLPVVNAAVGDDPRRWANLVAALRARPDRHPMTPGSVIARTLTPDPATPSGVRVSPSRQLVLGARQPRVTNVRPSFGPPVTTITLTTRDVPESADTLQVRFVGHRRSVTAKRLDASHFTVPARASFMPGPVAVETANGDVVTDAEDVSTWFLRTHAPIVPTPGGLTPLPGNATIRDVLTGTDDVRRFAFAGVAGTVVSAHAFSVDQ